MAKKKTKKQEKAAGKGQVVENPRDWEMAVSVAYLRITGGTQEQAAEIAGCSVRTVHSWEHSEWWLKAEADARKRWLKGVEAHAMAGISSALIDRKEYAQMSRYVADRMIPEMQPPKNRNEHSGPGGAPIPVQQALDLSKLDDDEYSELKRLLRKARAD